MPLVSSSSSDIVVENESKSVLAAVCIHWVMLLLCCCLGLILLAVRGALACALQRVLVRVLGSARGLTVVLGLCEVAGSSIVGIFVFVVISFEVRAGAWFGAFSSVAGRIGCCGGVTVLCCGGDGLVRLVNRPLQALRSSAMRSRRICSGDIVGAVFGSVATATLTDAAGGSNCLRCLVKRGWCSSCVMVEVIVVVVVMVEVAVELASVAWPTLSSVVWPWWRA